MAFIAAAAPVLAVVGSLVGAAGTVMAGQSAAQAGKYQQRVAEMNAQIAEENSRRAIERSQIEQQDQDMLTRAELGTQEAMQGASGLSIAGGSQVLTRKSAAMLGRRDALNVRQQGELESYNYKTQAVSQRAEGELAKAKGQSALVGSYFNAAGNLISSASSFGTKYDNWKRKA